MEIGDKLSQHSLSMLKALAHSIRSGANVLFITGAGFIFI